MRKDTINSVKNLSDPLTDFIQSSAQMMIKIALQLEVEGFLKSHEERLSNGKKRVVKNGYLPVRDILTGIGKLPVEVPRVRDRGDGSDNVRFESSLIPKHMRRTATLDETLPLLYLKGVSERDFSEVLTPIFGEGVNNLSPKVISRLKKQWEAEQSHWSTRDLSASSFVYWWVDGLHLKARADDNLAVLVVIGVNAAGEKEMIAIEAGFRESTQSWLDLLRNLASRGLSAPLLAVGDGALGFWHACEQVYPDTRHQRCWVHKIRNVLNKLPQSLQAKGKRLLNEIYQSPTRDLAEKACQTFVNAFYAKYPKATTCLLKDKKKLLAFFDFPAEHWVHLRTTNPIESTFATVRNRTYKAKGAFSQTTICTMVFKLLQSAQKRWRKIRGVDKITLLLEGRTFKDGILVNDDSAMDSQQVNDEVTNS